MESSVKRGAGIAIAAALVFGSYWWIQQGAKDDARGDLMSELRQFERYEEFRALLNATVEELHPELAARLSQRKGAYRAHYYDVDYERYRAEMYRALGKALRDAGEEKAAIELERHRSRHAL